MKAKILIALAAVFFMTSCNDQDVYDLKEDGKTVNLDMDMGTIHSSILQSEWWNGLSQTDKDLYGIELASSKDPITYAQFQEKRNEAIRTIKKNGFRAKVCPGYPESDPALNPEGHVDLCTQADVDAIGAMNCKEITGRLRIFDTLGVDPICDLTPLRKIKSIGSALNIQAGSCLTSLDGLDKIKTVGLNGPFGFVAVNGPSLTDISALSKISTITGSMNIIGCSSLVSTGSAFSRVSQIASGQTSATLTSQYVLNIDNNAQLTDISSLSGLTTIERGIYISDNQALTDIDALSNVGSALELIIVFNNASLLNVDGLSGISTTDRLVVIDNPSLNDCCGLYNLLCNDPPTCSVSGVASITAIVGNGVNCTEADIIAGGPCV